VGIWIIWTGAIMIGMGIPWAFYVKPWLVRRQSEKLRRLHSKPVKHEPEKELVAA
jgi:hypothetical protein